jgi:hypothetical protein
MPTGSAPCSPHLTVISHKQETSFSVNAHVILQPGGYFLFLNATLGHLFLNATLVTLVAVQTPYACQTHPLTTMQAVQRHECT